MANDENDIENETPENPESDAAAAPTGGGSDGAAQDGFEPEELDAAETANGESAADINLDLVLEVPVTVSLQVGSTEVSIRDLVQLVEGSVVALDRDATEPLDVLVNGTLIAHGEIVVVDDAFGVRLTDVVSPAERIRNINQ